MTQDNVNNTEPVKEPKICPILNSPCIKDKCEFNREFKQSNGVTMQVFSMCAFNAISLILSEINQKTIAPQQKFINIPTNPSRQ